MKRKNTSHYIVELQLKTELFQEDIINTRMEIGRSMYNALLTIALHRFTEMTKTKRYRTLYENLIHEDTKEAKEHNKPIWKQIDAMYKEFKLTEFDLKNDVKLMQHHFKEHIQARIAQAIATQVYSAICAKRFKHAKELHYKKFGTFNSLRTNENGQGIIFKGDYIAWTGLKLPIIFPKNEKSQTFIAHNLFNNLEKLKYGIIVRKEIRGKYKYYVQLVFEGTCVKSRYKLGKGRVGIDIGTSTIAVSSDTAVELKELSEGTQELEKEKLRIQRKMDRSRLSMNPNKYNENGTIKKENKDKWINSNRYLKLRSDYREICRKQRILRRLSHNILSNYLLTLGDEFYVETMNFSALQRRSKKPTEYVSKNKCKRKKRFGKSIGSRAPALLIAIIDRKLHYFGKHINKVNTQKCKASQFNHITQEYTKKSLSTRWNTIEYKLVQRDLYSAFLISNTDETLESFDMNLCNSKYDNFLDLHDKKVQELKQQKQYTNKKFLSCIGI